MKIPYFCCIGAELKRYSQDFDFMNQIYLYKVPTDDSIDEVLSEDYFRDISNSVLQDDIVYIYEASAETLHECRFDKQNGHITAVPLASDETLTGAVTSIIHDNLTPNKLLKSDENGKVAASDFSENDFVKKSGDTMTGDLAFQYSSSYPTLYMHQSNTTPDRLVLYKGGVSDKTIILDFAQSTILLEKVHTTKINNGYDIAIPVTNSADTLALKSEVDLAANSGRMITDQGVWYAKMYAATVAPSAENGTNYADFSQVDGQGNPIVVIYERQNGAWVQDQVITPPAEYDGYVSITSKIWDITEQAGQQGGRILWNHQSKEFTPYPQIISFENAALTGVSTAPTPTSSSPNNQIATKGYVDSFSGANTSLSNLTATGANISNWSSNVSNCITEIPQDIKLTIDDSHKLILSSGSSAYLGDGTKITAATNVTYSAASAQPSIKFLILINRTGGVLNIASLSSAVSAATNPGGTYRVWFNTTDGKCYLNDGSENPSEYCLPIAIATHTNGTGWTKIDQVFNGFGYIGSTIFVLPNVKYLVPNGRNADGTLNNTAVTITSVKTRTFTDTATTDWGLGSDQSINQNPQYTLGSDNYLYATNGIRVNVCASGVLSRTNGVISSMTAKTAFHAVDYNESDFVVAFQRPTSANNYTWYRKYKSGWVEQGGANPGTFGTVNLPVEMASTYYNVTITPSNTQIVPMVTNRTTTSFVCSGRNIDNGQLTGTTSFVSWQVSGMAA